MRLRSRQTFRSCALYCSEQKLWSWVIQAHKLYGFVMNLPIASVLKLLRRLTRCQLWNIMSWNCSSSHLISPSSSTSTPWQTPFSLWLSRPRIHSSRLHPALRVQGSSTGQLQLFLPHPHLPPLRLITTTSAAHQQPPPGPGRPRQTTTSAPKPQPPHLTSQPNHTTMPTSISRRRSTRVSTKPAPDYTRSLTVTPTSTRSPSPTNPMTSNPLPPPPTVADLTSKLAPVRASRRLRKPSEKAEAAHTAPHNLASPPRDDDVVVNTNPSPQLPEKHTPAAGAKRKSPPAAQPSPPPTAKRARTITPQKRSHKKKPRDTTRVLPPSPSATTESVQSNATDAAMEKEEHGAVTTKKKECAVPVGLRYGGATPELRRFLSAAYRHFKCVRAARWYKWNGKLWETFTVAGVYGARRRGVLEGWRKETEEGREEELEEEVERLVRCVAEMVCEDGKSEKELLASWGCEKV